MAAVEPPAAPSGDGDDLTRPDGDDLTCPWCGSGDVRELAPFGTLLMTAQWFCEACHSPFERIRRRGDAEG